VTVTQTDDARQSPEARAALAALPEGSKINYKKSFFLGGKKDDAYALRLKEFHDRLRIKSTDELREIRQYFSTIELQLNTSNRDYDQAHGNKNAKAGAKFWNQVHGKWTKLQSQLEAGFSKWAEPLGRKEYYQAALYELTRTLGDQVSQLHTAQHAMMTNKAKDSTAAETALAELAQRRTAANDTLTQLRGELERIEKLPPTANGMPQR